MSQFLTDGTNFFHLTGECPKGFKDVLWMAKEESGNDIVLTNAQIADLKSVPPHTLPAGLFGAQDQREDDFLVYAASGIDPVTAAAVTADDIQVEPNDSVFGQASQGARDFLGFIMMAVVGGYGTYIGVYLYVKMMGFI